MPASVAASVLPPEDTATCGIPIYPAAVVAVVVVPSAGNSVVLIVEDPIVIPVTFAVNMLATEALFDAMVGEA